MSGDAGRNPRAVRMFMDRHYSTIASHLSGGGGRRLVAHMTSVITSDRVLSKLELPHPGEQIYFGNLNPDTDRGPVYEMTGVTPEQLRQTIKESPLIQETWQIATNPFNWLMAMVIKWYHENGTEQEQRAAVLFLTVHFYASIVYKYYTRTGGYQPQAMAYAVNTLTDKFTLKQEGTMFKALMVTAWKSQNKYTYRLEAATDYDLFQYFLAMHNRINGMMRSIASHYWAVRKSEAYLNMSRDRHPEGELAERSTDSGRITVLVDKFTESFVGEPIPQSLVLLASRIADAPSVSLSLAIGSIRETEGERVREIFQLILEIFFEERKAGPDDIKTRSFLSFATSVYARSNTKDGRIERVKSQLDALLRSHSDSYTRTNREATKGNFRKSIYLFLVLFMQHRS